LHRLSADGWGGVPRDHVDSADSRRNDGGRIRSANPTAIGGTELREGDAVTVSYTNRDGKIIAQNVKVNAR